MPSLTLYGKNSYKLYTIYDIQKDAHGFPQFLIYEKGQWLYRSAQFFQPYSPDYDEREQDPYDKHI